MMKPGMILLLVLSFTFCGCTNNPKVGTFSTPAREIIITAEEARTGPILTHWEMGEAASMEIGKDRILSILGFRLNPTDTTIYYALSNISSVALPDEYPFFLTGNEGSVYRLVKVIPFYNFEPEIEIGALVFEPRNFGVSELYLQTESEVESSIIDKLLAAKFSGSTSEDRLGSTYTFRREGGISQNDYRIEMFLWSPPRSNSSTPTPPGEYSPEKTDVKVTTPTAVIRTPVSEEKAGRTIIDEVSFKIQNTALENNEIVFVQFLDDGTVILENDNEVITPKIIIFPTIIPSWTPYPAPPQP